MKRWPAVVLLFPLLLLVSAACDVLADDGGPIHTAIAECLEELERNKDGSVSAAERTRVTWQLTSLHLDKHELERAIRAANTDGSCSNSFGYRLKLAICQGELNRADDSRSTFRSILNGMNNRHMDAIDRFPAASRLQFLIDLACSQYQAGDIEAARETANLVTESLSNGDQTQANLGNEKHKLQLRIAELHAYERDIDAAIRALNRPSTHVKSAMSRDQSAARYRVACIAFRIMGPDAFLAVIKSDPDVSSRPDAVIRLLEENQAGSDPAKRARLLSALKPMIEALDHRSAAMMHARVSLVYSKADDRVNVRRCIKLAEVHLPVEGIASKLGRFLALTTEAADMQRQVAVMSRLALASHEIGDAGASITYLDRAKAVAGKMDNQADINIASDSLATHLFAMGRPDEARDALQRISSLPILEATILQAPRAGAVDDCIKWYGSILEKFTSLDQRRRIQSSLLSSCGMHKCETEGFRRAMEWAEGLESARSKAWGLHGIATYLCNNKQN